MNVTPSEEEYVPVLESQIFFIEDEKRQKLLKEGRKIVPFFQNLSTCNGLHIKLNNGDEILFHKQDTTSVPSAIDTLLKFRLKQEDITKIAIISGGCLATIINKNGKIEELPKNARRVNLKTSQKINFKEPSLLIYDNNGVPVKTSNQKNYEDIINKILPAVIKDFDKEKVKELFLPSNCDVQISEGRYFYQDFHDHTFQNRQNQKNRQIRIFPITRKGVVIKDEPVQLFGLKDLVPLKQKKSIWTKISECCCLCDAEDDDLPGDVSLLKNKKYDKGKVYPSVNNFFQETEEIFTSKELKKSATPRTKEVKVEDTKYM